MKRLACFVCAALGGLLAASPARAAYVPWSYDWQRSPVALAADSPGTGGVNMTNEPIKNAQGTSDIVATNLRVFSSAPAATPDMLSGSNGDYTLSLTLTDTDSGMSAVLTWTGRISGTFSAFNSLLTNEFTSTETLSVVLGLNTYTVTIGPYSPPGPPTASNAGSIAAHVEVTPGDDVEKLPEPSTLVLSCVGAGLAGLWRRRRLARA